MSDPGMSLSLCELLRLIVSFVGFSFAVEFLLLLDLDLEVSQSPQVTSTKFKTGHSSEEDSRFSHPLEVKRHKHAGYIVRRPKYSEELSSPSAPSTSSIIHLKEKLAALPAFPRFNKEPVSVVAEPSLSRVTECNERDRCGVKSAKSQRISSLKPQQVKSRSDSESTRRNRGARLEYAPVSDDNEVSLSHVCALGPDETVINESIERLSKDNDGKDIVNLLFQEAILAIPKYDSGINTDEKKSQEEREAIEDTPNEIREARNRVPYKKHCHISSTDDESNTEAINETPAFLMSKKSAVRGRNKTPNIEEKHSFDVKVVEEFFSQHVAENQRGEIVVSPRLAKKINETSSETSDNYLVENALLLNEEIHTDIEQRMFDDVAIIDCLNEMVDTVCRDFDNFTNNVCKDNITEIMELIDQENLDMSNVKDVTKPKPAPKSKNIKLKYKPVKKAKPRSTKKSKAVQQNNEKKMSTIIEQKEEEMNPEPENKHVEVMKITSPAKTETPKSKIIETRATRKKRKLYSPKDDAIEESIVQHDEAKTSDDVTLAKIKKIDSSKDPATATCYKEIEKERKKYTRLPRNRRSKSIFIEPPSPRTAKNNTAFDSLKETTESNETIMLANKGDSVYNFSGESEDEDFKEKKIEIKKRTIIEPKVKGSNTRRGKGSDTSYEDNKTKPVRRKPVTKRTAKQKAVEKVAVVELIKNDLVDEKMREAVREQLNTSIVVEPPTNLESVELEPTLHQAPQMEHIQESESNETVPAKKVTKTIRNLKETQVEIHDSASNDTFVSKKNENKRTKKTKTVAVKNEKGAKKAKTLVVPDNDEGTSSPLPGLVVEKSKPKYKDDINDSLNTNMLQKFKKIYRDGPEANESLLTQCMLSDVEKLNSSAQNYSHLDEICFPEYDKCVAAKTKKENTKTLPTKSNKKVAKTKTEMNEVIEIEESVSLCGRQSDKSISTDGITAHLDVDKVPPATESIVETLPPREITDLSEAMKDYYIQLTRELQDSSKDSVKSNKSTKGTNEDDRSSRSPVVPVKRLSLEDISKWMPSRRTSDSDSPQASLKEMSPKIRKIPSNTDSNVENTPKAKTTIEITKLVNTKNNNPKPVKIVSPKSTADSVKLKSPSVSIPRMSLEEFNKWLPAMPVSEEGNTAPKKPLRELKLIYPTRSQSKVNNKEIRKVKQKEKSPTKTVVAEVQKSVETIFETDTNNRENIQTNVSIVKTRSRLAMEATRKRQPINSDTDETRSKEPKNKELIKINTKPDSTKIATRKSVISPIKLFEDFATAFNISNDENDTGIANLHSKPKESTYKSKSNNAEYADTILSNEVSTPETRKRKNKSPILSVPKKKRVQRTNVDERNSETPKNNKTDFKRLIDTRKKDAVEKGSSSRSEHSSSTVNNWLNKTDSVTIDKSLSQRDAIQNVMERLDTTLVEINHNTSRKFVNLFVETQSELNEITEHLSKTMAMVESFKEKFKTQASTLVRDDCQQRRAMVMILKDDVQAVLDCLDKKKNCS